MNDNTNQNTRQQDTQTPAETGGAGRLFTQEEVNAIVQDRLAREREKLTRQTEQDERERALEQREQALNAKEARAVKVEAVKEYYKSKHITGRALDVAMKGSGAEIDALELTDGKVADFSVIDALIGGVFSGLVSQTTTTGADVYHPPCSGSIDTARQLADAFKPEI